MVAWDVIRNRRVHEAYWIWLAFYVASSLFVGAVWDTPWWHATARHILAA
jgi:hypothetical protein